jgi:hypothetical protein
MSLPVDEIKINEIRTQLNLLAKNLLDALEENDRAKALVAQQAFTGTIATLWNATGEIEVDRRAKAIIRLVAGWAIMELPNQIQDPISDERIKRELKIFRTSLILVS